MAKKEDTIQAKNIKIIVKKEIAYKRLTNELSILLLRTADQFCLDAFLKEHVQITNKTMISILAGLIKSYNRE
jgi:hypothetical protein